MLMNNAIVGISISIAWTSVVIYPVVKISVDWHRENLVGNFIFKSPQQGQCCDPFSCSFLPQTVKCFQETFCSTESYCTYLFNFKSGYNSKCPKADYKNQGLMCNSYGNVCLNGVNFINTVVCRIAV